MRAGITQPKRMMPLPTMRIVSVAQSPEGADHGGVANLFVARDDRRDGDHVIGMVAWRMPRKKPSAMIETRPMIFTQFLGPFLAPSSKKTSHGY